jgi:hypothetical protein
MSAFGITIMVWVVGWMLAVRLLSSTRQKYSQGERRNREKEIVHILDLLSVDPSRTLVLFLIFWPFMMVALFAMRVAASIEKRIEKLDERDREHERLHHEHEGA